MPWLSALDNIAFATKSLVGQVGQRKRFMIIAALARKVNLGHAADQEAITAFRRDEAACRYRAGFGSRAKDVAA